MTAEAADTPPGIGPESIVRFHELVIRQADDDPDLAVIGRIDAGQFVEVPAIAIHAIQLLDQGMPVVAVEQELAGTHALDVDVAEMAHTMAVLGFVVSVDGRSLPDVVRRHPSHLPQLRRQQVAWLFGWPPTLLGALLVAAASTVWRTPDLLPRATDFYWTPYVGIASLVNTAMLMANPEPA